MGGQNAGAGAERAVVSKTKMRWSHALFIIHFVVFASVIMIRLCNTLRFDLILRIRLID